ncbi:hypothetical protein PO78_3329 [Thauera sp. SWB20]|nr:hypothetical protein PO78_3329 [Thauera sp. SWB20]
MPVCPAFGLNPFDIRASVRTSGSGKTTLRRVSIPLISGHQSGLYRVLNGVEKAQSQSL